MVFVWQNTAQKGHSWNKKENAKEVTTTAKDANKPHRNKNIQSKVQKTH